uniref:pyridine nucleotide-disulfide oxidoreductase domain-containing protein 2-like n=1 Tax=Styela clava TaxID=7725 RepID=UPI001939BB7C|nr:pyridine nucleotide-disulfide oxidoreductase domain-containing protein 2-like [Styela clava]
MIASRIVKSKAVCSRLPFEVFQQRCLSSVISDSSSLKSRYDAIVIGAGHNGLISATYLAMKGLKVGVFERRHVVGGAAVTEEIVPGYKFSRASYVLSLLRPRIIKELNLEKHGLKVHLRQTVAFTPILEDGVNGKPPRSLCLYPDEKMNEEELKKFSMKDAKSLAAYDKYILDIASAVSPLLETPPPNLKDGFWKALKTSKPLLDTVRKLDDVSSFYDFITSPITKTLDRWFETDVLKATLATDGVIGAMVSPHTPGSSYVLLHHMIGEAEGIKGAWGFVEGGMGAVSNAIAASAKEHGVDIFVDHEVQKIDIIDGNCGGITLSNGNNVKSNIVLSNATPHVTFQKLLADDFDALPEEYRKQITSFDYTSPVTKLNIAVDRIPNFLALQSSKPTEVPNQLKGTIHLNCEDIGCINDAYLDAMQGRFSRRPMIELCIPSTVDTTLAPKGHHVLSVFTQYTPYYLNGTQEWTDSDRDDYRKIVFKSIEDYAPGFIDSVVGYEVLTPMDLENTFGLTGGNIFHGAIGLDQLFLSRPTSFMASQRTPLQGLYICGSGTHPGGGVMGACGRLGAMAVLSDLKSKKISKNLS